MVLYPGLVYNIQYMSGALFQFVAEKKRKAKASSIDILAAGGRYDKLISIFSRGRELPSGYGAVGVSINVERIIQSAMQEPDDVTVNTCDVMVCAVGENPMLDQRLGLVVSLRELQLRISASIWYEPLTDAMLDDTQAYCQDCGIQYMIILEENAPTRVCSVLITYYLARAISLYRKISFQKIISKGKVFLKKDCYNHCYRTRACCS